MKTYGSIREIRLANRIWAMNNDRAWFFDDDAMLFFSSEVMPKVYHGRFFVTSEQYIASSYGKQYLNQYDGPKKFTVRVCREEGKVETMGYFQAHDSLEDAERWMLLNWKVLE